MGANDFHGKLGQLKKKLKKEEDNRRAFTELAKKKDEELKKLQTYVTKLESDSKQVDQSEKKERVI